MEAGGYRPTIRGCAELGDGPFTVGGHPLELGGGLLAPALAGDLAAEASMREQTLGDLRRFGHPTHPVKDSGHTRL
jgi:hypothetical protein